MQRGSARAARRIDVGNSQQTARHAPATTARGAATDRELHRVVDEAWRGKKRRRARRGSWSTSPQPPAETGKRRAHVTFEFALNKPRLREWRRRAGRSLLRTHLTGSDPATLWQHDMTRCRIEEAFRNLQGDLSLRYRISTPSSGGSEAKSPDYPSTPLCLPARQSKAAARVAQHHATVDRCRGLVARMDRGSL